MSDSSLDLPLDGSSNASSSASVIYLEHVNFEHSDADRTMSFYRDVLGLTIDKGKTAMRDTTIWLNVGLHSQLHLPLEQWHTRILGATGLVLPSTRFHQLLDKASLCTPAFEARMKSLDALDARSQFLTTCYKLEEPQHNYIELIGPHENPFHVHCLSENAEHQRGIAYVLVHCPLDALDDIEAFWSNMFRTPTKRINGDQLSVSLTNHIADSHQIPAQQLIFLGLDKDDKEFRFPLFHICIYVSDFSCVFDRLNAVGLVASIDNRSDTDATTWPRIVHHKQFRALHVPSKSKAASNAFSLELEIRSVKHRHYMRNLNIDD